MVEMKPKHLFYSLLLAMLVASSTSLRIEKAHATAISVSPITTTVNVGNTFTVDINLDYAQNLYGFQIYLSFDRTKLSANSIDYVNYLNEPTHLWDQEVNNAIGYVSISYSSQYPALPVTGGSPPPLAKVNFTAISAGSSALHLYNTVLVNSTDQAIPHATVDGTVQVTSAGIHDVAVTNVTSHKKVVFQNFLANFTVTVENHGGFSETFNVTLNANTTMISKKLMTNMPSGTSTVLNFTWSTTGFGKGNYSINALADVVLFETKIDDNNLTDGWIMITIVGDLTGAPGHSIWDFVPDGAVDGSDLIVVARCFGSWPEAPPPNIWNTNCDINNDGGIDGSDLIIVARHFGEHA